MNDSQNNKEMIAIGHEFARSISSDTPIIEIAKMITRLAGRLDCATLALREMTKQRDAADQAGRVWERTMMDACGEDGPKSVADKFAEMKARCAALAAENAALKAAFIPEEIPEEAVDALQNTAEFDWDSNDTGSWQWIENDTDVIRAVLDALKPETPATDAFLAEMRASTLDEFARAQDEQAKKLYEMSPGCSGQDECQFAAGQAWYFAECIRKGVHS